MPGTIAGPITTPLSPARIGTSAPMATIICKTVLRDCTRIRHPKKMCGGRDQAAAHYYTDKFYLAGIKTVSTT